VFEAKANSPWFQGYTKGVWEHNCLSKKNRTGMHECDSDVEI
jgi:hypothetical protein